MNFIEHLSQNTWDHNLKIETKKYLLKVPKIFSISANTDESIDFLKKFFLFHKIMHKKPMHILWSKCEEIDLSASLLLTLLTILFGVKSNEENIKRKKITGSKVKDNVNALLWSNSLFKYISDNDYSDEFGLKSFNLIIGGKSKVDILDFINKKNGEKELLLDPLNDNCTYISNYISNESEKESGRKLNLLGCNKINSLVGEILTNCKEHLGNKFSQYFVTGLFKKENLEVNLSFVNFGDTFAQGIKNNSKDIKQYLDKMIKKYQEKNICFNEEFTEEMFCTLYAFQFRVSREFEKDNDDIRGTGIKAVLDFFFNLLPKKNVETSFSLISGSTKISIDLNDRKYYNKGILIFNNNSSLLEKQNTKNIIGLKNFFPGTIISINFGVDESWLEGGIENE